MMKLLSRSLMLLCLLGLAACAQLRPVSMPVVEGQGEPTDFRLEGRLAVRADGKGYYANFDWLRRQGDDDIAILKPAVGCEGAGVGKAYMRPLSTIRSIQN